MNSFHQFLECRVPERTSAGSKCSSQNGTKATLQWGGLRVLDLGAVYISSEIVAFAITPCTCHTHAYTRRVEVHGFQCALLDCPVDWSGAPNISPKEIFVAHGTESVLIANIASPTTIRNIQVNPKVCLSFVDVFIQKGYKLLGTARIVARESSEFAGFVAPLEKLTKGQFRIHSVICTRVERVESIVAPSYRLKSGTTESSQVQSALNAYRVTRNEDGT